MSPRPHLLLVEDDEMVCDMLREVLDEEYDVSCVATGKQAVAEIAGRRFDTVLLDYRLSDGNGQRVADFAIKASVPVVWMTGDPEAARKILGGSHVLLTKPFGIPVLRRMLAEALACR